jgi:MFS family permease/quinol monooxygenase YgiN
MSDGTAAPAPAAPPTIRAALQHRPFRALLAGGTVYFVGSAMQGMATAWLVIEQTGSSFLAALVQTALFLPMFVMSLPAGVLADTTDRRRMILGALIVQALLVALLTLGVAGGWAGAGLLLVLTFLIGSCTAVLSPPWNSAIVDVVPREQLPQAITAISIAYNLARALGPALAGALYAWAGGGWVFALALLGVVALFESVRRHPPRPHPPSRLPPERLWGGMLSGLRFVRHSEVVLAQLLRISAYCGAGAALWALLPVIGQQRLGLGATGFGFLIGCMGTGAVIAGFVVGRVRARWGLERLVGAGSLVFAAVMAVAAVSRHPVVVYVALLAAGASWLAVTSTYNTATQTSVPPWVRARATALHTLSALGAFALGSAFWGAVSDLLNLTAALLLAAAAMAGSVLLARRFPLRVGELHEVTQATLSEDLFLKHQPDPEAGPVSVEVSYRIRQADAEAFLDVLSQLRGPRQRDGAALWRVYRDLDDPSRFVERFIVNHWADYLRQRARTTVADQALEARLREFLLPGEQVTMQHYIAER